MIHFKVVRDINQAKVIWQALSPNKTLDDQWDFRFAFVRPLHFLPYFVVAFDDALPVGLLPLQVNTQEGLLPPYAPPAGSFLEFFGGDDTDDNQLLLLPGYDIPLTQFLEHCSLPTLLAPLRHQHRTPNVTTEPYEYKYLLDLTHFMNYDDYLSKTWSSDSANRLRNQMRKLYRDHQIEVTYNDPKALDLVVELNRQRFGESSSFRYVYRQEVFRNLMALFPTECITITVDGRPAAAAYAIRYNNTFVGMNMGADHEIRNLGKLLNLLQIDRAIALGMKCYDAGKGNSGGWKTNFKFEPVPQYQLSYVPVTQRVMPRVGSLSESLRP